MIAGAAVVAGGLAVGGCAAPSHATTRPAGFVDNPDYLAWAAFGPGSFSVMHHETHTSGFAESAVRSAHPPKETGAYDVRSELTALTPQRAEVTITVAATRLVVHQTIDATVDPKTVGANPAARDVATTQPEKTETVTAGGVDYDCRVYATRTAEGMAATGTTNWVSPKVPGGLVKTHASRWSGPIHVTDDGVLTDVHVVAR